MAMETENPAASTAIVTATATNSSEIEISEETLAPTSLESLAPASENLTTDVPPQEKSQNGPANDTHKKICRAERFGVPLQLSEDEKRSSRAQRFGTLSGSGALKSSEELKRKARAERFGSVENSVVNNEAKKNSAFDDEAKKKARLARFGSNAKADSQEEEKKRARALRFASSAADSQTKTDCKGNIELTTKKTAVIGGTIGGT